MRRSCWGGALLILLRPVPAPPRLRRCALRLPVRAFIAGGWLLTEIDPDDHDLAFGLCDLGLGIPEIGWVSLDELATVRSQLNATRRSVPRSRRVPIHAKRGWQGWSLSDEVVGAS